MFPMLVGMNPVGRVLRRRRRREAGLQSRRTAKSQTKECTGTYYCSMRTYQCSPACRETHSAQAAVPRSCPAATQRCPNVCPLAMTASTSAPPSCMVTRSPQHACLRRAWRPASGCLAHTPVGALKVPALLIAHRTVSRPALACASSWALMAISTRVLAVGFATFSANT